METSYHIWRKSKYKSKEKTEKTDQQRKCTALVCNDMTIRYFYICLSRRSSYKETGNNENSENPKEGSSGLYNTI